MASANEFEDTPELGKALVDGHAHLDQYPPQEVPAILERSRAAGVGLVVTAGTTLESSQACVALAQRYAMVYAGVGLHPMELTAPVDEATWAALRRLASEEPKVVVVSEVGLDFAANRPPRELQETVFRQQIRLARELRLPIVFHTREATGDTLRLLGEEDAWEVGGAWHYFLGDEAQAREALELRFLISLAPPLLRLAPLQRVASRLPLEGLVLESDAFPQPWRRDRKSWTEPRDVRTVAQKLAELRGISLEEVQAATTENLLRMLQVGRTLQPPAPRREHRARRP